MRPIEHFRFCPRCGGPLAASGASASVQCGLCGFLYHFNPAAAAGAFILRPDGAALFIERSRDPARGLWALPGGFIDIGETAEAALRREIFEEVGLTVGPLTYLGSCPNDYAYQGVTYPVLDFFFVTSLAAGTPRALDGVRRLIWRAPEAVDPDLIAFPSVRWALNQCVEIRAGRISLRAQGE